VVTAHLAQPDARPLLIIGAGGFGRETVEAVRALNAVRHLWDLRGFLDDDPSLTGTLVGGLPVLGTLASMAEHPDADVVVTTGRPSSYFSRKRIVLRLGLPMTRFATVVHPAASVAASTQIGGGCVVLAGVVSTADARIGAHVVVMPGVVLPHDVVVGDFATLASGLRLSGGVTIEEGAYVGAGALVREGCRVGRWSLVGMGAVVLDDVPAGEVWAGVPARHLRRVDIPGDVLQRAA
jgi:sugar O-acyltransferase (sialic acid O-acetyltransferase NeuD family)